MDYITEFLRNPIIMALIGGETQMMENFGILKHEKIFLYCASMNIETSSN